MRKFVCAATVVVLALGVALADDFAGAITKVDGKKVTVKKGKDGEAKEYTVASDVKVVYVKGKVKKGEKPEAGDVVSEGLKNEAFSKAGDKAVGAYFTTNDKGEITHIYLKKGKKGAGG